MTSQAARNATRPDRLVPQIVAASSAPLAIGQLAMPFIKLAW
jgi:hypothetical protein